MLGQLCVGESLGLNVDHIKEAEEEGAASVNSLLVRHIDDLLEDAGAGDGRPEHKRTHAPRVQVGAFPLRAVADRISVCNGVMEEIVRLFEN